MRLIIFLLLIASNGFAQDKSKITFIKKDNYGSVYITADTSKEEYNYLPTPKWNDELQETYIRHFYDTFTDTVVVPKHFNLNEELIQNWIPLYLYKDKLYAYAPSDWINSYSYSFSDSVLINNSAEGPFPLFLDQYVVENDNSFRFHIIDAAMDFHIRIKIIDRSKSLTLWEFEYDNGGRRFQYFTSSKHLKKFPLVICECNGSKCLLEYKFQTTSGREKFEK